MTHTQPANDRYAQLLALSRMGANRDEAARSVGLSLKGLEGLLRRRMGSDAWPIDPAGHDPAKTYCLRGHAYDRITTTGQMACRVCDRMYAAKRRGAQKIRGAGA